MRLPSLLREDARFRRFWAGQAISLLGDRISLIALPLVAVLALDATAAQMGYLVATELAPNLLFSLHAGAWADRRARKRRTMIATDVGRAALIGSTPLAYAFDARTFPHMLVVAFLMGSLSVLFQVSYSSLDVALVPRERLVESGSIMHGSRAFSFVAGPSVGGLLVQALSAPAALVADACSYVLSALFLRRVEAVEPEAAEPGTPNVASGARFILGSRIVRAELGARHARPRARARPQRSTSSPRTAPAAPAPYATTELDVGLAAHRPDRPTDRDRACVRPRLPPLPGAAPARAARRRSRLDRARLPTAR